MATTKLLKAPFVCNLTEGYWFQLERSLSYCARILDFSEQSKHKVADPRPEILSHAEECVFFESRQEDIVSVDNPSEPHNLQGAIFMGVTTPGIGADLSEARVVRRSMPLDVTVAASTA